jgi:nucleoside diphosphate kinase
LPIASCGCWINIKKGFVLNIMKKKIISLSGKTTSFCRDIIYKALTVVEPTILFNLHKEKSTLVHQVGRVLFFIKPNLGDQPSPELPLGNSNFSEHNLAFVINRFAEAGWELEALKIIPSEFITPDMIRMHYPQMFAGERYDNMRTIFSSEELNATDKLYLPDHPTIKIVHAMRLINDYGFKAEDIYRVWGEAIEQGYCTEEKKGVNAINSEDKSSLLGRTLVALVRDQEMCSRANRGLPFLVANGFSVFYSEIAKIPKIKIPFMIFRRASDKGVPIELIKSDVIGSSNPRMAKEGSIRNSAFRSMIGDLRGFRAIVGPTNNGVHCSTPGSATKEISMFFQEFWLANEANSSIQYAAARKQMFRYQHEGSQPFGIKYSNAEAVTDSSGMVRMSELCKQDGKFPVMSVILAGAGSGGRFFEYQNSSMQNTSKSLVEIENSTILGHRLNYFEQLLKSGVPIKEIFLLTPGHHHEIERHLADVSAVRLDRNISILDRIVSRKSTAIPRIRPFAQDLLKDSNFKKENGDENQRQMKANELGTKGGQVAVRKDGSICFTPPGPICALTDMIQFRLKDMIKKGVEVVAINSMEDIGFMLYPGVLNHIKNGDAPIYYSLVESETPNFSGGGLAKIDGKQCIVPRKNFAGLDFKYKNTFHVYLNVENLLKWLGTTKEQFLSMDTLKIRRLINLKIFSKINPTFEVKPYEGWVGQFTWHIDDLAQIMPFGLIFQDNGYSKDFCEIKTGKDMGQVVEFLKSHSREFGISQ